MVLSVKIGLLIMIITFIIFSVSLKKANELEVRTIRDLCNVLVTENYIRFRAKPNAVNFIEIDSIIENWFVIHLGIKKSELEQNALLF